MSTAIIVSQVRGINNKNRNIQSTTTSTNKCSVTAGKATIDNRRTFLATVKDSSAKVRDHRDMALRPSSPANQKEKLWRIVNSST